MRRHLVAALAALVFAAPLAAPMGFSGDFSSAGAKVSSAHRFSESEGSRPSKTSFVGFSATSGRDVFFLFAMPTSRALDPTSKSILDCLDTQPKGRQGLTIPAWPGHYASHQRNRRTAGQ